VDELFAPVFPGSDVAVEQAVIVKAKIADKIATAEIRAGGLLCTFEFGS
jgi:hypothetical protein